MAGLLQKLLSMLSGEGAKLVSNALENKYKNFTFPVLPKSVEQLKALPEASLTDPYAVAALTIAVLAVSGIDYDVYYEGAKIIGWFLRKERSAA